MHKKILAICAALVALGALVVAPTMASAATLKDTTTGAVEDTLAVGAKILAISEETSVFQAGSLNVECNENYLTGEVHQNNGTQILGTITHAKFQGPESETKCKSSLGATRVTIPALTNEGGTGHWCVQSVPEEDKFQVFGRSCTEAGNGVLTFVLDAPLGVTCRYKRELPVTGTLTTNTNHEAATLSVTGEPVFNREETSSGLCPPASEPGKIKSMKFRLYTDKCETGQWHCTAATENPVYITNP